jgi:hypothetical protein
MLRILLYINVPLHPLSTSLELSWGGSREEAWARLESSFGTGWENLPWRSPAFLLINGFSPFVQLVSIVFSANYTSFRRVFEWSAVLSAPLLFGTSTLYCCHTCLLCSAAWEAGRADPLALRSHRNSFLPNRVRSHSVCCSRPLIFSNWTTTIPSDPV